MLFASANGSMECKFSKHYSTLLQVTAKQSLNVHQRTYVEKHSTTFNHGQ